jgi:nickel-dependent lactate racemase
VENIEIFYNNHKMSIPIPENVSVDSFAPTLLENHITFDDFVREYNASNADLFFNSGSLVFIVNDSHRNTPTAKILDWFKRHKPDIFAKADFIIASGTHIAPDQDECRLIFGETFDSLRERVSFHDCKDKDLLRSIGVDNFGEEVFLNKKLFEYDNIFAINSVEPHYFAGFTGGRKSIVPGLADFKTIERNHNLASSLECAPLKVIGNPMAEHLDSIIDKLELPNLMTLQIVYDAKKNLADIFFGNIRESFHKATELAKDIYSKTTDKNYDVAILEILPPLDRSMYQAQKALENNHAIVNDDGLVIIVSACNDGIGSDNFFELAQNWDIENNCPKDGIKRFGSHKLSRVNSISKRIDARLFSELDSDTVNRVFYKHAGDIPTLLDEISERKGNYNLAVVHDAAHTVLQINK